MLSNTVHKQRVAYDFSRAAKSYHHYATLQRYAVEQFMLQSTKYMEGKWLDIGAGTGFIAEACRKQGLDIDLIQLDIALGMCRQAKRYGEVVNADMEQLPMPSSFFDGICSSLSMQWSDDLLSSFKECYRVIKKGGYFTCMTLGAKTLAELRHIFTLYGEANRVRTFSSADQLKALLEEVGFVDVTVNIEPVMYHYDSLFELLKQIKQIGGSNKSSTRAMYIGKQLRRLERDYAAHFKEEEGLPATWEFIYMTAHKHE